jgi:hypothetical protein
MRTEFVIPKDVLDLCEQIQKATIGYNVYIGGGYLRDLDKGFTPKDIDIFFIPLKFKNPEYIPLVSDIVGLGKLVYDYTHLTQDMKDRGVERVICFANDVLSTTEINFIVYDHYKSGYDLAADMDFGVNQIMYDIETSALITTTGYEYAHSRCILECLNKFSKERMYKRYQRMKAKFPTYAVVGEPETDFIERILWSEPIRTKGITSASFND